MIPTGSDKRRDMENKLRLTEENTSKVMMNDMPEQSEYSQVIYDAQETGKQINNFEKCQEANHKAWSGIMNLMARCVARGMRLQLAKLAGTPDEELKVSIANQLFEYDKGEHTMNYEAIADGLLSLIQPTLAAREQVKIGQARKEENSLMLCTVCHGKRHGEKIIVDSEPQWTKGGHN